jgi:hypothetical protein
LAVDDHDTLFSLTGGAYADSIYKAAVKAIRIRADSLISTATKITRLRADSANIPLMATVKVDSVHVLKTVKTQRIKIGTNGAVIDSAIIAGDSVLVYIGGNAYPIRKK